jgi:hypothetical protein
MSREPEDVLLDIQTKSEHIDSIYGPQPDNVIWLDFKAGTARLPPPDAARWKGRKATQPLNYDIAVTEMLLRRARKALQADLPPLAPVAA